MLRILSDSKDFTNSSVAISLGKVTLYTSSIAYLPYSFISLVPIPAKLLVSAGVSDLDQFPSIFLYHYNLF
nr:MAG TPA: hypothetical protein [Bacteriophage sp.]